MEKYIGIGLVFVSIWLIFYLIISITQRNKHRDRRIETFVPSSQKAMETEEKTQVKAGVLKGIIQSLAKVFKGVKFNKKTAAKLEQSGSNLVPEEFFVIKLLTATGFGVFAYLTGFHWIFIITGLIAGFVIPAWYINRKAKKRIAALSPQLVEALATMSNSMRAGFSFLQAMKLVGKEMPDPIGPEFERVVREAGLGVPVEEVFENMLIRLPNKELEVVVQAILAQRNSGGNLAGLLETMEETIRGRIRILEELKTLTAQGRMSSWVITMIPVGLALYLFFISPDYFGPMLDHPLGWMLLSAGSFFVILGWFLIQKIVQIEV